MRGFATGVGANADIGARPVVTVPAWRAPAEEKPHRSGAETIMRTASHFCAGTLPWIIQSTTWTARASPTGASQEPAAMNADVEEDFPSASSV